MNKEDRELEPTEIFGEETIVDAITSARLRWAVHVVRMDDSRMPKKHKRNASIRIDLEEDPVSDG